VAKPIFFDPTGKRRRWTKRSLFIALIALVLLAVGFASTVVTVPAQAPLPLGFERRGPLRLRAQVARLSHSVAGLFSPSAKSAYVNRGRGSRPVTVGFYPTWSDNSAPALVRAIGQLDWVVPTTLAIDKAGNLHVADDRVLRRIVSTNLHRPLVLPMVQNIIRDDFSGEATRRLLLSPELRKAFIARLDAYCDSTGDAGVVFDFEALPQPLIAPYRQLIAETNADFDKHGRLVAVTLPLANPDWDPSLFAKAADKLFLMAYDEHYGGGAAGPIASNEWFYRKVAAAMQGVPADKAIIALGSYAYDWHEGKSEGLSIEEAWLAAHDSGSKITYLPNVGNSAFDYLVNGQRHEVWMLDAAATWNQLRLLSKMNLNSVALWRLGSEDPGFWQAVDAWHKGTQPQLEAIAQDKNVNVRGQGEILRITHTPTGGERKVAFDKVSGLVASVQYGVLPTPYVVERTGARAKEVALTFDDGPDPKWTPQILSILEQYKVPGTFFIIGENGVANRGILQRIVRDGFELGNHSYTHPNMALESGAGVNLELNTTQRLVEAYTGRSLRLFRAPYFGDAEPTTADEIGPALQAQDHGYTVVGLHVDPGDWQHPGVPSIVSETLKQVMSATPTHTGNIVLLHDGGGNREQTVQALPAIIEGLQRQGYRFVSVAELAGLKHDQVMPELSGLNLIAVRADVFAFSLAGFTVTALNWVFFFAIALGIIRAVGMTVLATLPERRPAPQPDNSFRPKVTVIIPAYNEERVISSSVRRILDSTYPYLDVIVADDGSKDQTSALVQAEFGTNPRVRLLTMENGGKARALNTALQLAKGEVIVALDADTQFERETITRLVRWFVDPRIGAVSGNAKVGNRINLVTRWQGVEYVTAQNIERRALTRFDAIMVVPGAVGAWRRAALEDVGGYPEDTLAEDQDLTIAIQRKKWKVAYDDSAVAWTEAPETFAALAKQRFRWSYGTLQCLWKHRKVMGKRKPAGLAFVGMPQAWMFQILFAMISPAIDLALVVSIFGTITRVFQHGWAQTQTDVLRMGAYWLAFTAVDLVCGWIAYRGDPREKHFPATLLLAQRFIYRQLMYSVVIKAVNAAVRGVGTTWGKLERTGTVNAAALGEEAPSDTAGGPEPA
jgi:cellulose synthase/poly-beta-1,6-N-acetylglucosamine synthase-like glycosyltransferase/peptidoglycan/xylan/chitin deacetylase (PgdA/CDA1 family)/spore germination protein YaaH